MAINHMTIEFVHLSLMKFALCPILPVAIDHVTREYVRVGFIDCVQVSVCPGLPVAMSG